MNRLRILYVAYPLLPVTSESCGGAEQVLVTVEREMHRRGHETVVAAAESSRVTGELLVTVSSTSDLDCIDELNREHAARIADWVQLRDREGRPFDLIHDHSGSWWQNAGNVSAPVLATLHLPRSFYPEVSFQAASNVSFVCVSQSQLASFESILSSKAFVVENGVDLETFRPGTRREDFLLWLGRICHEKGAHIAIEVAQRSGSRLVLAGTVYPFSYHQNYFEREIAPHLGNHIRLVDLPSAREKLQLLQSARAVVIPSLVDETSSLVAMEALACGTPVVAFRRGALADLIEDGVTGRVVDSVEEMVEAVREVSDDIHPEICRAWAERNSSAERMCDGYERLYWELTSRTNMLEPAIAG